jgi:SAM-dependent methyltransferase
MGPACRFCATPLEHVFADLGSTPLANSYLTPAQAHAIEPLYPLLAYACGRCLLVQLEAFESPAGIFSEYAYFSSYSSTWLDHSRRYAAQMIELCQLGPHSRVVEVASNDGYLLQYFRDAGIPVLGIEPAANVAEVANERGIPTRVEFFGAASARALRADGGADLLIGNNVLAHVPDINDFVAGLKLLLHPGGTITMEFPHLLRLIEGCQWDTIYHEHFCYLSWHTARALFAAHGLRLFDVEELPTHGGSLRIYGVHADDAREDTERASELLGRERAAGLEQMEIYASFGERVMRDRAEILSFLTGLREDGLRIAGYGAPAKGNTMLNYCAIGTETVEFTCDLNPHKQGHLLPGSHIPIRPPDAIRAERPDVVLILPWNLRAEIMDQLSFIREWGGRFAARAPGLTLFE